MQCGGRAKQRRRFGFPSPVGRGARGEGCEALRTERRNVVAFVFRPSPQPSPKGRGSNDLEGV